MAEIAIKIGTVGTYTDGDVLAAFNHRRIRCCHAQHICFPKVGDGKDRTWERLNGAGLLDLDDPARDFEAATREYMLERLSHDKARIVYPDGHTIEFNSGQNFEMGGKLVHMDIAAYFMRKTKTLRSPGGNGQPAFGELGKEIIYNGRSDFSHAALDKVWVAIETKTPHREADYPLWAATDVELMHTLFIPVDDFDDATAADLVASEMDETDPENPVMVHKRKHRVDWKPLFARSGFTEADVSDKRKTVDLREFVALVRADIVVMK